MATKEPPMLLNLDDLEVKKRLMQRIGTLKGLWSVTLQQRKQRRSLNQNSYYWSCFVGPFSEWINENWGEKVSLEQAHETLKLALLDVPRMDGIAIMPSSKTLDTGEFSAYLERAALFLAEKCSIVVLSADDYFDVPERGEPSRQRKS